MISQSISDGLMAVEELRQFLMVIQQAPTVMVTIDTLHEFQHHMNHILHIVSHLQHHLLKGNSNDTGTHTTNQMLLDHVMQKAIDISQQTLQFCYSNYHIDTTNDGGDDTTNDTDTDTIPLEERRRLGQGCMARMTEVNIILLSTFTNTSTTSHVLLLRSIDDIVQLYVQFQKRTLRLRCKPHIAQLVQIRRDSKEALDSIVELIISNTATGTNDTTTNTNGHIPTSTHIEQHDGTTNQAESNNDNDDENDDTAVPVIDLSTFTAQVKQQQLSQQTYRTYHSPVFTILLGTAATLIHPLMSWMNHLSPPNNAILQPSTDGDSSGQHEQRTSNHYYLYQMCQQSIHIIDEQTQALVRTMNDWFYEDRKSLMNCCVRLSNNDIALQPPSVQALLGHLNGMVDEMAYIAQILERYQTLIVAAQQQPQQMSSSSEPLSTTIISKEILPEWIWQYSTYERIVVLQQWQISIAGGSAIPVCIVIGTDIKVSSCIEDAQYISTRTMDRAISTQSIDAISTVAYTIIHDIWSTDHNNNDHAHESSCAAVFQALMDEIGCWSSETTTHSNGNQGNKKNVTSAPASGSNAFASALLDALDDDLATNNNSNTTMKTPEKSKPPSSGGTSFLSSLMISSSKDNEQFAQRQFDTLYCVLNSMNAASGACQSLATTLDDILYDYNDDDENDNYGNTEIHQQASSSPEKTANIASTSAVPSASATPTTPPATTTEHNSIKEKAIAKIQLTRDDVLQYSTDYQQLLLTRIDESIDRWCYSDRNQCLYQLEYFFNSESYHITDGATLQNMEQDERLIFELIAPFQQNVLLQQFTTKCDAPVLLLVAERVATRVVDIILHVLWNVSDSGSGSTTGRNDATTPTGLSKKFTDWGALLLSKQSRMLQQYISTTMIQPPSQNAARVNTNSAVTVLTATKVIQIWERLSYVITVLQLEKPMDWITYYHSNNVTSRSSSTLSLEELSKTLYLRVDFSSDAIEAVVSKLRITSTPSIP